MVIAKSSDPARLEADAAGTAAAEVVRVPVEVSARKPGYAAALAAARDALARLEADAGKIGPATVAPAGVRLAAEEKGAVLVQVGGTLAVTLPGPADFWTRADAVARVLDLVQRYCEPAKPDRELAVYAGPARPHPAAAS
jgi:hypothetical protein